MALTFVKATDWTFNSGFFTNKASFVCGSCRKHNQRKTTTHGDWSGRNLAVCQCQWCGEYNAFSDRGRFIFLTQ